MMVRVLSKIIVKQKYFFLFLVVGIALMGGVFVFPLSYLTNTNEVIGLCILPFAIFLQGKKRFNYFFFVLMLLFCMAAFVYNVRLFYFFSLSFYILWVIEILIGRVNFIIVFLIGFMSPFFVQAATILGFPIRLQLSNLAGTILQWIGMNVQVEGNVLLLNGAVFSVDEACMGLNMLALSLLMGVFILVHHYRKHKRLLTFGQLMFFFLVAFLLNVLANLFRIIILVLLTIMPEAPMHEVIGVLCLVGYVVIPLYVLGDRMVLNYGRFTSYVADHKQQPGAASKTLMILFSLVLFSTGISIAYLRAPTTAPNPTVTVQGLPGSKITDGITKLESETILIYVKPIAEFFTGEHTPLLCWKGSGYTFKSIKKSRINGQEIYSGQLEKENDVLFTAWWYSNGKVQTISQFNWRMRMLQGERKFCLVNLTAKSEANLFQNIEKLLGEKMLTITYDD